jgi:hypothetical protein
MVGLVLETPDSGCPMFEQELQGRLAVAPPSANGR